MSGWKILWSVVLFGGLGVFAVMSVWVTIAGWRDIWSLFGAINKSHEKREE